jgi:hypothetical protein
MPEREVSAEEIASWYTPLQALGHVATIIGPNAASNAVWQRIVGGLIEAAASHSSHTRGGAPPEPRITPSIIPKELWKYFQAKGSDFWKAGDAQLYVPSSRTGSRGVTYTSPPQTCRHFGIKLNPADVERLFGPIQTTPPKPAAPVTPQEAIQPISKVEAEPAQKGPRVPDAHLQAWFEFYKKVHKGPEDTEEHALEFARQCFPAKSVSRDRVRALRGAVKRGPKPKPA